jgi:UDPglucose--hexose-1-phosphate uridylyltransferase
MSELRQDRATGRWVLIAPERGERPHPTVQPAARLADIQAVDPSCPFCPGNERFLPQIIAERPAGAPPGWSVRVVPNKYPAVSPRRGPLSDADRGGILPGFGYHEVIIETPRHDLDLATLTDGEVAEVVRTYRDRFAALAVRPGIKSVVLFRNRGTRGGASLSHPHSQVIALGMKPPRFAAMTKRARAEFERTGRCATCVELAAELADGCRLVEATDRFAVLVPFAATLPFELSILPIGHPASFGETSDPDCAALAHIVRRTLRRLDAVLHHPSYNAVVEAVVTRGDAVESVYSHWSLNIAPPMRHASGLRTQLRHSDQPIAAGKRRRRLPGSRKRL